MAGKFEIYEDRTGNHRVRLKASNGQIMAVSEAYETRAAAKKGCEAIQRAAQGAPALEAASATRARDAVHSGFSLDDLEPEHPARRPDAGAPEAVDEKTLTDGARRREAVTEALSSVRLEGLEPTVEGLHMLEAVALGRIDEDDAIDALIRLHRR